MNCLWLLLLGQALVVVRTEQKNSADPSEPVEANEPPTEDDNEEAVESADPEKDEDDDEEAVESAEPEKDEDDEVSDYVEEEEEEEPAKPSERQTWLPACQLDSVDQPELKGDHTCRLSLTVKRKEHWTSGDSHELYLRGTVRTQNDPDPEAGQPAKGAIIATANGFTRFTKKVTIKYMSKGKEYEATLKRSFCPKGTVCKQKCKGSFKDVDEIVNSPVDALTYTLCDKGDKRGPTIFKMFFTMPNPKLNTIVRMTYGVFGSVPVTEKDGSLYLPFKTKEIHNLLQRKKVVKLSNKNGMLSDGNVDPSDPSKFIPKPKGQIRYSAQSVRGKYGKARQMYFVDVHSPWSAVDAFAYSLALADNAQGFNAEGVNAEVKAGWNKVFG